MKKIFKPLCLLVLVGCSSASLKPSPESNIVENNSSFMINLPENHTTGYLWQLYNEYDESKIEYINSVWHGNEKGINFNFESKATGNTTLKFALIKYQDTIEVKTFNVTIQ